MTISGDKKELDKVRAIFGIKESVMVLKNLLWKVLQIMALRENPVLGKVDDDIKTIAKGFKKMMANK